MANRRFPCLYTRRTWLRAAGAAMASTALPLFAAQDFWNKKPVSAWNEQEIAQLLSRSPWSKEINAEFTDDSGFGVAGEGTPSIGRGGLLGAPGANGGTRERAGGAKRREPVTIRWESAQPILDAMGRPLPGAMAGRYAISVSGLPLGVMQKRRRSGAGPAMVEDGGTSPRDRMIEELMAAATLEARGKEPAQPGVVLPMKGAVATYLFGFSKELLPLDAHDRDILFTLKTAFIALKARFEPKEMMYRGQLAL